MKATLVLGMLFFYVFQVSYSQDLESQLLLLGFENVSRIEIDSDGYTEAFKFVIAQPIDHDNPGLGHFYQRVILRHRHFDQPMVMVTEGYGADYALNKHYNEEIAYKLQTNLLVVEHRYFGVSVPDSLIWEHLNLYNATTDLHLINLKLKTLYTKPWISTGISKGGQTALYYRYFYPDDVRVTVPYVAPLNFSDQDKRVYKFLNAVADKDCRNKLQALQVDLLQRRTLFEPMFSDSITSRNLTFNRVGGIEKAYEYNILEFGFAYWQWYPLACEDLPEPGSDPKAVFDIFAQATGYDFFSDQSIAGFQPFFYQALTEMGFYSYDTKPFKKWLNEVDDASFLHTIPEGIPVAYSSKLSKKTNNWLRKSGNRILYVYGAYDAWTSTAVQPGRRTDAVKLVLPSGSHTSRLRHFDDETQQQAYETIQRWLIVP